MNDVMKPRAPPLQSGRLLDQVSAYTDYLRTLGGKLSHELATPLAVVKSSLENLEQEAMTESARIYAERGDQAEIIRWLEKYLQHCDTEKLRGFLAPGQLSSVFFRLGMAALRSEAKDNARTYFATCAERFKEEDVAAECRKNLALLE